MKPVEEYIAWRGGSDTVGCVFARLISRDPGRYGQRVELVTASEPAAIAAEIDARVSALIPLADAPAATLVIPALKSSPSLVAVALGLQGQPGWRVDRWTIDQTPAGPVVAFGVSRTVALASGTMVPSEALFLGPFDGFPATRMSPVAALEIFVGTPPAIDPKTGGSTTKANLAHLDVPVSPHTFKSMWDTSGVIRRRSLGLTPNGDDQDHRAKAKVAFVVPLPLAQELGCAP